LESGRLSGRFVCEAGRFCLAGETVSLLLFVPAVQNVLYSGVAVKYFLYSMRRPLAVVERLPEDLSRLIQRALEDGPFSIQQLAEEAGISYDTLYSWAKRRRVPRPENLQQLARAFDQRAERLQQIAEALRRAADSAAAE
jgi:predicted DNA-binding transcriptional regulator AlpA